MRAKEIRRRNATAWLAVLLTLMATICCPQAHAQDFASDARAFHVFKGSGGPEDAGGQTPVVGARFQARQLIGLSATTSQLGELTRTMPQLLTSDPGYPLGAPIVELTDLDGFAHFIGLADGVYQVSELPQRIGNDYEQISNPFLVVVRSDVTFEPQIHAKSLTSPVVKTVDKTDINVDESLNYQVEATVVEVDASGKLYQLYIIDQLDDNLRNPRNFRVTAGNLARDIVLDGATDYTVAVDGQRLDLELTEHGLEQVAAIRPGHPETKLKFSFDVDVAHTVVDGVVVNNCAIYRPDGLVSRPLNAPVAAKNKPVFKLVAVYAKQQQIMPTSCPLVGKDGVPVTGFGSNTASVTVHNPAPEEKPWYIPVILLPIFGLGSSGHGSSGGSSTVQGEKPATADQNQATKNPLKRLDQSLAMTGASIIGLVIVALLLALGGLFFLGAKRRKDEEEA
ncbi:isopeptide-forming domain-containing fimbrial protein [Corynebacterium epidermidicanis]|uniref:Fimbrial isopeptide formation D2 domain n=1 Tax=Corynebacterium epidermidicanis TaxID=1050174 RepID=A0A0G3GWL4_9CORY|nr:isopeptide-forming domain-containing fimbrial protein [Corynebacterium epidermidicanis]AKK03918.1 fimbrial isopeptide formation D2 domain [Corynebacterium epidermidicanis]